MVVRVKNILQTVISALVYGGSFFPVASLSGNGLFLYNYTAELNVSGHYDKSLQAGKTCEQLWADCDLQMLMADNHMQLQQYDEAEQHYRIPSPAIAAIREEMRQLIEREITPETLLPP